VLNPRQDLRMPAILPLKPPDSGHHGASVPGGLRLQLHNEILS
jgi:hypothetical protein